MAGPVTRLPVFVEDDQGYLVDPAVVPGKESRRDGRDPDCGSYCEGEAKSGLCCGDTAGELDWSA